jgi:histidinol dehydrogenase
VDEIVRAVRERGDAALIEFTERFDGVRLTARRLRVSEAEVDAAIASLPRDLTRALRTAAARIRRFQKTILLRDPKPLKTGGRTLRLRYLPVDSAGICVPGASASLASSVLATVVPASAGGVKRIAVITPPRRDGTVSPDRLAAARIAGATEIYRVFGAQAVAALAFGTETIRRVDFIAGPGNAYVVAAKKAVFGEVGIDMLAGPSEVAVIADRSAPPDWVAAELLSQAEHNEGTATLITNSARLAERAAAALDEQLGDLPRGREARSCLERLGAAFVARSLNECADLANRLAAEHLVIMTKKPDVLLAQIRHAGAIFIGPCSPVAVGDYIAGPSHCLPTGMTARFSSGLTANHFLKSSSIIRYDRDALAADAEPLCRIAAAEQLEAHARSVRIRLKKR